MSAPRKCAVFGCGYPSSSPFIVRLPSGREIVDDFCPPCARRNHARPWTPGATLAEDPKAERMRQEMSK